MKHHLLFLGKTKDTFIREGIDQFAKRLKHYTSFSITTLKDVGRTLAEDQIVEKQGQLLLKAVPRSALIVALDPGGKQFSSEDFAEQLSLWEQQSVQHLCYLIGGPDGHSSEVLQGARLTLSLSKMTFTHDMTRLLLIEQLYRAYTIKAGEKYHK